MTEWITLRAKFPDDEYEEIERIKEKYDLSINEIIRTGVKFYVGLTLAKEVIADTKYWKQIKIRNRNLQDILNSPKYQQNLEQKIIKLVKIGLSELMDTGLDLNWILVFFISARFFPSLAYSSKMLKSRFTDFRTSL